ncbi:MAG: ferrochelatase, partial [Calditrichaceae bacterium]
MRTAVIISNMGGPDSLEAVEPYLFNIFNDPDIIDIPFPGFIRKR